MKIFLAFAFRDEDKECINNLKLLFTSHGIEILTGENLGGEELTPAIKEEIEKADALVAVLTKRQLLTTGGWTTHQWVVDELNHAYGKGKMAIALIESDIALQGMAQSHQYIHLDKSNQIRSFLELSQTIGRWKSKLGSTLKFQILPHSLAARLASGDSTIECKFKLWTKGVPDKDKWENASKARIAPEDFATFAYVDGVQENQLVQLRVMDNGNEWLSPAKSQWTQIELSPKLPEQPK
jgi:hypothetical protein